MLWFVFVHTLKYIKFSMLHIFCDALQMQGKLEYPLLKKYENCDG